ncbi:DUF6519 domain-containing protein [Myceligenerans crystallogenes]|uniref:PASTA domain-containing protein n=1 Tax=Myceligenerans crystallogenes TaxID=316335 RepID=A0ABN2N868_9MICO
MHADLTRRTFDPALGFRSVLMQQGRVLLDAEWNEQAEITAHHDRTRAADVIGPSGGPEPLDGGPGPFAVVSLTSGEPPAGPVAWADLGVTPGRYYVDGVLAESAPGPGTGGTWPLAGQPHLRGVGGEPGLAEPAAGTYAAVLDVFDRLVTADERPQLLESALGGPDTAAREQTVWQVLLEPVDDGAACSTVPAGLFGRTPRTMRAGLQEADAPADPCSVASGGGYQLLENQLYRVEIWQAGGTPAFLWSRENGSVVAGLVTVAGSSVGFDAALTLDRAGRDEELSIGQGDLIEVTSADLGLRGRPGYLARVRRVVDLVLDVDWLAENPGTPPTSVAALGGAPVVRRWEGGPLPLRTTRTDLEGGITVAFPAGGSPAVGDHWLIPARTVRLAYGVSARTGTIEWPGMPGTPAALPPTGPVHRRALLGLVERAGDTWTVLSDCRHLFPPLTATAALDLLGGDGQEAAPGVELPAPVRVAVRRGSLPVAGETVRFTAAGGTLSTAAGGGGSTGNPLAVPTGADGVAAAFWTPDPRGQAAQTLTAERLTDVLAPADDVAVIVTARVVRPSEGRPPGLHVAGVRLSSGPLENDAVYHPDELSKPIVVALDDTVLAESVKDKPVGRLLVELPWPVGPELDVWGGPSFATHTVELLGTLEAEGPFITWSPAPATIEALPRIVERLRQLEGNQQLGAPGLPVLARFQLDGWAIVRENDPAQHLNGHASTFMDGDRTRLELPTTDAVTGGRFETWFHLDPEPDRPDRRFVVEDFTGRTLGFVERRAAEAGVALRVVEESAPGIRANTVLGTDARTGTELRPGDTLTVRVASGR